MSHRIICDSCRCSWFPAIAVRWLIAAAILALAFTAQSLRAQSGEMATPGGLRLRNVSAYAAYYSNSLPVTGFQALSPSLGPDMAGGGSAEVGWTRYAGRSQVSLTYTPSYTGRVQYSQGNALNHAFSLSASRNVTPRLNVMISLGADFSNVDQFLFAPTTFSNAASVPATFDDLSAALLSRNVSNPELASVLSNAPLADSPARNLLYGERMFTSGAQTALSYSWSPRLSVNLTARAGRNQRVSDDRVGIAQSAYLISTTTSGGASVAISYSLSPVTQLGVTVGTSRVSSQLQDAYTTTSHVSVGRTFANRWLLNLYGGVGVISPVRQTAFLQLSTEPRPVAGGSLGFKTAEHTFLGSYDRAASESYGVGAATSSSASLSWRWGRRGGAWWMESSLSWEQLQGSTLTDSAGWRVTSGLGRKVGMRMALLMQYVYLDYSGRLQRIIISRSQSAARLSLIWSQAAK